MPIFPLNSPGVKYSVYIRALIMVGLNFSGYGKISHLYFRSQILLLFLHLSSIFTGHMPNTVELGTPVMLLLPLF